MGRYRCLFFLICIACPLHGQTPTLTVERKGNHLKLAAPELHFVDGEALERLHNGASVTYDFDLTLAPDQGSAPVIHVRERFILSYDLWEERFAAVKPESPARSASHLTAAAAESWCLDNLSVPVPSLTPEKAFVIKLECRAEKNERNGGDGGLTLAGLIDVFSRKGRDTQPRWQAVSRSLRLADLK